MADDDTSKLVGTLVGAYVAVKVIDAIDKKPKKSSGGLFGFSSKKKSKKMKGLFS